MYSCVVKVSIQGCSDDERRRLLLYVVHGSEYPSQIKFVQIVDLTAVASVTRIMLDLNIKLQLV